MVPDFLVAAGGLGLFLLGMVVMSDGLKTLAGDALRRTLTRFTRSPLSGAVTGATVTALIQSSSATTVTAVGFVGAGLLTFSQALGIVLGANIGTTATGWLVAVLGFKLQLGEATLPLVLLGVLMRLLTKRRLAAIGLALAGFGLIFVGIGTLQDGLAGLEGVVAPEQFPDDSLMGRLLLVLIGLALTLVTQSSSAGVAMALVAVHAGTITLPQAAAMVIGMDIGTTVTAAMATIGGSTDARRTAAAHVTYNLLAGGGAFFFLLMPYVWACRNLGGGTLGEHPEIALVAFHSLYNTLGVVIVLPFTTAFTRLVVRIVPEKAISHTRRLDPTLYESPAIAVEAVRATLKELTQVVFGKLAAMLADRSNVAAGDTLEEANEGLKRTRDYLEPIDTSADHGALFPKHLSAIHTIDHLRRLIDRCQETDRARRVQRETDLAELGDELREAVDEAAVGLEETPTEENAAEPSVDRLEQLWRRFDAHAEQSRHQQVEQAASGKLGAFAVIGKLDALRWLRRVAYHVWRIVHHLSLAQLDRPVQEDEQAVPEGSEPEELPDRED